MAKQWKAGYVGKVTRITVTYEDGKTRTLSGHGFHRVVGNSPGGSNPRNEQWIEHDLGLREE